MRSIAPIVLTTVASLEGSHGTAPYAGLVRGKDGAFYGTTSANGGIYNYGTVIRVTTNGVLTVLAHFNYGNGAYPSYASLVEGNDGAFYGTTEGGGNSGCGVVFRVTTNGLLTAVASFAQPNGMNSCGPMVQATDGAFYGTTVSGGDHNFGSVFRMTSNGVVTTLISFDDTNGAFPQTGLMQGRDGALFGTTGGGFDSRISRFGTVFRLTLNGQLTTLVRFTGYNGREPRGPLVQGRDDALYGTAGTDTYGMVYRLTTSGTFTMLAAFDGVNGSSPRGSMVEGTDGAFYGTTAFGGANNDGTVFRVTTNGELKALVSFNAYNGAHPLGGLISGSDGALYGTTLANGGGYSQGTVFRVTTNGLLTTLTTFNSTNGGSLRTRLVQGQDGALYGMTASGGSADLGTVFRVTTNGILTTLASFNYSNGASSSSSVEVYSGLTKGHDGVIYGTAFAGGSRGGGNIFRVDLSSVMQALTRQSDGWQVRFIGLPEMVYRVQRAETVIGPWNTIGHIEVGTNGLASYVDGDTSPNNALYRMVQP